MMVRIFSERIAFFIGCIKVLALSDRTLDEHVSKRISEFGGFLLLGEVELWRN